MKRFNNNGETLIETLVSMLIVTLCFSFLVTCIVQSYKTNNELKKYNNSFTYDTSDAEIENANAVLNISDKNGNPVGTSTITLYENNGYYYYEKK